MKYFILLLLSPVLALAEATVPIAPDTVERAAPDRPDNVGPTSPDRVLPGEPSVHKSYLIPAMEIPLFILLLNRVDLLIYGPEEYDVSLHSTKDHVTHAPWVIDQDEFTINQIGHPYQGAMYYGFARSANLNFWESYLYANVGSVVWEIAGETTNPSVNDQVASGTAGSFLGEALYRLSNRVLEEGGKNPGTLRHVAAGLISPPTELNRFLFGDRFGPVFESRNPAMMSVFHLGSAANFEREDSGSIANLSRNVGYGAFSIAYGLPGRSGYRYQRPFDYFDLEVNSIAGNHKLYPNGMIRGMLFGYPYEIGNHYRGIWGLYGSYDYLSPQVYRVSTTAASLGTTAQWSFARHLTLQGTASAGLGFGSAGTILPDANESDYHYGATPLQLLNLRLLLGKRAMLNVTGRNYWISELGSKRAPGTESIQQVDSYLTVRLYGRHGISIGHSLAHRNATYSGNLTDRRQRIDTFMLMYTLLGHRNLGRVGGS